MGLRREGVQMNGREMYDAEVERHRERRHSDHYTIEPTMTVGRARAIIEAAKGQARAVPCKLNPSLTEKQLVEVLKDAVEGKPDSELVHFLLARNIVRGLGSMVRDVVLPEGERPRRKR